MEQVKMTRKGFLTFIGSVMTALLGGVFTREPVKAEASIRKKHRVVYHLSEPRKVKFVLGNITNHIRGVGGPENADIVLVVHGPALKEFLKDKANFNTRAKVELLGMQGVRFEMCGNTMRHFKVGLEDLLEGFVRRDEGAVVRIVDLQMQGYKYLRP